MTTLVGIGDFSKMTYLSIKHFATTTRKEYSNRPLSTRPPVTAATRRAKCPSPRPFAGFVIWRCRSMRYDWSYKPLTLPHATG